MKKSWRTSAAGWTGIVGLLASALAAQFDSDPSTIANWQVVIPAIITSAGLLFARDNTVTSEQAGAKNG